jgi:hypothetical protein
MKYMKILFSANNMPVLSVDDALPPAAYIIEMELGTDNGDIFSGRFSSMNIRKLRVYIAQRMGCKVTPLPDSPFIEVLDQNLRPRGV